MTSDIGATFRALHQPGNPFILANAWDIGSAKMLAGLGAQAIATSSAAHAFTLGRTDGNVTRDEALSHASNLVDAVNIPISGDFENGFGDAPETVAETVRLAAEAGLAGISIEDTALPAQSTYDFDLAVDRIRAACAAARALPQDFILVARADGIMTGQYDIEEGLKRLTAFEEAGADCLYAPLPETTADLARICSTINKPINALVAGPTYTALSRSDYAKMGVARISLGSALARATHSLIHDAALSMFERGNFIDLQTNVTGADIDALMG